jgi:hypothetical protein
MNVGFHFKQLENGNFEHAGDGRIKLGRSSRKWSFSVTGERKWLRIVFNGGI